MNKLVIALAAIVASATVSVAEETKVEKAHAAVIEAKIADEKADAAVVEAKIADKKADVADKKAEKKEEKKEEEKK